MAETPLYLEFILQQVYKQWGTFQDGTNWDTYFSFPITFPTACYASCVTDIYDGDKNEDVYFRAKPTTTKFRIRVGAGFSCPHLVIAIGKQQWGYSGTKVSGYVYNVSFPISFSSDLYSFVTTGGSATGATSSCANYGHSTRTRTYAYCISINENINFIALGY